METQHFDICIVGAGVAGGLLSYQLAQHNWKVLLIEAGQQFDDSTRHQRARDYVNFGADPWAESGWRERDRYQSAGPVQYGLNGTRVFGVGGSTLHWGGLANRLHADDFAEYSNYGVGVDWPISYRQLEPYYLQAERRIGVAGPDDAPFSSYRSDGFPMKAFPLGHSDQYWKDVCEQIGITIHPTAWAKNSVPYDDRPACNAFGTCLPICPIKARYSADHHVAKALDTGNVTFHTQTAARRILTAPSGDRVTGILATDTEGRDQRYQADAYVLAAHAVESARLLLLSANKAHPNGLGNQSDQVGRNFMEHWYVHGRAHFEDRQFYPWRIGFDAAECHQFYSRDDRDEAGAIKLELSDRGPRPAGIAQSTELWGEELVEKIRSEFGQSLAISAETEHLPYSKSRVELHDSEVNVFGDPIPVVRLHLGEYERATRKRAADIISRILHATDAEEVNVEDWEDAHNWASHHMGTCRMGADPESSVVDPNLRVHRLDNLFVASSAVFPTAGAGQPTLTIAALTLRLADHLDGESAHP